VWGVYREHPRRAAGVAAVLLAPPLWFLARALVAPATEPVDVAVALLGAGVAAGVAVTAAPRLPPPSGPVARAVLAPSRVALATVVAVWTLVAGAATLGVAPALDGPAAALGLVVGLPLAVAYGAAVAVGSATGGPAGALATAGVGVGVAASTAWTLLLVAGVEALVGRLRDG